MKSGSWLIKIVVCCGDGGAQNWLNRTEVRLVVGMFANKKTKEVTKRTNNNNVQIKKQSLDKIKCSTETKDTHRDGTELETSQQCNSS